MQLAFITNDVAAAQCAEQAGVDRVIIDLERYGKSERQAGRGLFLSSHQESDVPRLRDVLRAARLMVRVDPIHAGSPRQVAYVLDAGADYVMLPYFHRLDEVHTFLKLVGGRARPVLLVETREAALILDQLCAIPEVAELHIGLNDLSLSLGRPFLLDIVADGTVGRLCEELRRAGKPFGYGGVGSLSRQDLPVDPELLLADQVTQGGTRAWLGRTFRDVPLNLMELEIGRLRSAIDKWRQARPFEVATMRRRLKQQIEEVANRRAA